MLYSKKGASENFVTKVIMLFVVIIIALAFLGIIANSQAKISDKLVVTNESDSLSSCYAVGYLTTQINESNSACNITLTNAQTDWRASDTQCALGNVVITNSTGSVLVSATDYNMFTQTGVIQFLNTTDTESTLMAGNISLTSYNFCDAGYLQNASDRALIKLIVTLLVIVLLVTVVGVVNKMLKD